jgi:hypothetical protein
MFVTSSRRGLFIRQISVQLVDLSLSGCLLRSQVDVPAGSHGELHIEMGGRTYRDGVFVTRSQERQGTGHTHDLGGEFLWGNRPDGASVRSGARSIIPH